MNGFKKPPIGRFFGGDKGVPPEAGKAGTVNLLTTIVIGRYSE